MSLSRHLGLVKRQETAVALRHAIALKKLLKGYKDEDKIKAIQIALKKFQKQDPERIGCLVEALDKVFPELKIKTSITKAD